MCVHFDKFFIQEPELYVNGLVRMGRPRTFVNGKVNMHLSTTGDLVKSLMPSMDMPCLVKVLAELTQNVMDWAFSVDNSYRLRFGSLGLSLLPF